MECSNNAGNAARGDVLVHEPWEKGESCILDMRVTDTDAKSYGGSTSAKVLEKAAREKKAKYEKACLEQRRSFMALVYSVDKMAGKNARAYKKRIVNLLADKWSRKYSSVAGWIKARMALAVVRSNTILLRGGRTRYSLKPDGVDCGRLHG